MNLPEETIHTTAAKLNIDFDNGKYYVEDSYGNNFYLCLPSKKEKLFEFYRKNEVQFLSYQKFVLKKIQNQTWDLLFLMI